MAGSGRGQTCVVRFLTRAWHLLRRGRICRGAASGQHPPTHRTGYRGAGDVL